MYLKSVRTRFSKERGRGNHRYIHLLGASQATKHEGVPAGIGLKSHAAEKKAT
jgi:hypothetical protein